jgi:hypothetical protein
LTVPDTVPLSISDQPRSMFSTWLGTVLLFLFFGLLVLVVFAAIPRKDNYEDKRAQGRAEKLKTARDEMNKALTTYAWIDKGKGTVRIPIERAMELAVVDLASKKPMMAGPITAVEPAPAASATPAASASSAPTAKPTPKPTSVQGPNSESRGQPAAAVNPPGAPPGTQPGPSTKPAAASPAAQPPKASSPIPTKSPMGSPIPAAGATP